MSGQCDGIGNKNSEKWTAGPYIRATMNGTKRSKNEEGKMGEKKKRKEKKREKSSIDYSTDLEDMILRITMQESGTGYAGGGGRVLSRS